jgi:apolipoprotein N-acyltransferase
LALAAAGGVVTDLAFPGLGWWPLAFVGTGLLVLALGRDRAWWNALVGLVWGIAFFVRHLPWVDGAVGLVPYLALSLAEAGAVALFGAAWTWARRGRVIRDAARWQVPAAAALWTAVEELRSVWPFGGFPWGRLAFSQADSPVGRLAWLGGAPLVSVAVMAGGALVAVAVARAARWQVGTASGALLVAVAVAGVGWLLPLDAGAQDGRLVLGAVQGDVPERGLESLDQARLVLHNHAAGSTALLDRVGPGKIDLLVWPENGADYDPRTDAETGETLRSVTRAFGVPLLLGTQEYPQTGGRYNLAMLWDPERGPVETYAKRHPAPFAEYIPIRDIARRFSADVDRVTTDMLPGRSVGLLHVDVPRLGRAVGVADVICFEVAYDDIVREAVAAGGEVLVVQTNNATFGRTDESTQQLAMSQLRAIEHGRATLQISTVGVSGVIAPNGVVTQRTGLFTAEQLVASVPLRHSLTPATRFGAVIAWALRGLGVVVVVAGMVGAVGERRERARARAAGRARSASRRSS